MKIREIICVGEILWDSLPAGLYLGGAPFNVAHDLHMMGGRVRIISRVGRDKLGDEVMKRLKSEGMYADLIQVDDELPTGLVEIVIDRRKSSPTYRIKGPVAWDSIEIGEDLLQAVADSEMLVFGTLASRNGVSRRTIHALIEAAPLRVYDVNLRPGTECRELVSDLLAAADIVKANVEELDAMREWFGLRADASEAAKELAERFACKLVAISFGSHGGGIWHKGRWVFHPGFNVRVETPVGAGDAFLAGLLSSLLEGKSDEEIVENANVLGAYVVTRNEAAPVFDSRALESIRAKVNLA